MNNQLVAKDINATYKLDSGEQIDLNLEIVRNVIAKGNNITNSEVFSFIKLCQYQKLNPFLGEAYLIKFGKSAQLVVGKDVFTNRLNEHPKCEGWQPGLILQKENGEIEERKGSFYIKGKEKIVGAWITIKRKDWKEPFLWSVSFHEYYREHEKDGKYVPMGQWGTMPSTMIIKCAITSGARNVFPKDFKGMYGEEEMGVETKEENVIDITIDDKKEEKQSVKNETKQKTDLTVTKEDIEKIYDAVNSDIIKINSQKTYEFIKYTINQLIKSKKLPAKTTINNLKKDKSKLVIDQIKEVIKAAESKHIKKEGEKIIDDKEDPKMQEMNYEKKEEVKNDNDNKGKEEKPKK